MSTEHLARINFNAESRLEPSNIAIAVAAGTHLTLILIAQSPNSHFWLLQHLSGVRRGTNLAFRASPLIGPLNRDRHVVIPGAYFWRWRRLRRRWSVVFTTTVNVLHMLLVIRRNLWHQIFSASGLLCSPADDIARILVELWRTTRPLMDRRSGGARGGSLPKHNTSFSWCINLVTHPTPYLPPKTHKYEKGSNLISVLFLYELN